MSLFAGATSCRLEGPDAPTSHQPPATRETPHPQRETDLVDVTTPMERRLASKQARTTLTPAF